jgi:TonB family protein
LLFVLTIAVGCSTSFTSKENARLIRRVEDALDYDNPPMLVKAALPEYPDMARQVGAEGRTVLKVLVLEDGSIGGIQILECPNPILVDAAVTSIRASVFAPAHKGREAVRATMIIPFVFSSEGHSFVRIRPGQEVGGTEP